VHHYRILVTPVENHDKLNEMLSGPRTTIDEKPPMMTEAARKIPMPSWWSTGGATVSQANLVAAKIKER
jgi:hypothetical protein